MRRPSWGGYSKDLDRVAVHIIPIEKLSREALTGVIDEFISRDGTDYGVTEAARETKFHQIKTKLEKGIAVLVFDDESETTNIFAADNPILKKIRPEEKE